MTTDPFIRWRGTDLWRVLDDALLRAEADGVVQFSADGGREAAIGHLCVHLDAEGVAAGTRLAGVRAALHRAGWGEEDYADSFALEICALLDWGKASEEVAEYIRRFENDVGERTPSTLQERLALAAAVLEAYRAGGGTSPPPA